MQKVLIVDDEVSIRQLFENSFSGGCRIFAAADGVEALALVKKEKPDLIFLDIGMPGISGLEVLRRLKAAGTASVVWMLTGKDELEVVTEAMDLGAAGYLTKPFEVEQIREIVNCSSGPGPEKSSARPWVVKRKGGQVTGKSGPEEPR